METLRYSIIYAVIRSEIAERLSLGLITVADWLKLEIDKTSLENKVFPAYQEYVKYPTSKIAALKPMFSWLNFEV